MKTKMMVVAVAVLLTACFSGTVFAQSFNDETQIFQKNLAMAKLMKFEGTVLTHDVACHCIVLKTAKGELTLQDDYAKFEQEYDRAKGLKIGSKISGTYKTVSHINYAIDIASN